MKTKGIFDYRDYRKFLTEYIQLQPKRGHGEKSKLALAIRCHNAYFSQILQGKADLSLEQALALTDYLGLSKGEADFFLLLIQYSRAGNPALKKHFFEKIEAVESSRHELKNRLKYDEKTLSKADQTTYFSAWYYSVIHLMIATLKGFQTLSSLEKALALPPAVIREAVLFLEKAGILEKNGSEYSIGKVNIHLGSDSSLVLAHHTNWRMQSIRSLESRAATDLHYSSVVTLNEQDFEKVRKSLVESIEAVRAIVADSDTDGRGSGAKVAALTLDWFSLFNANRVN